MTFHQCVNLGRFNTEKVVSFVPPDGEFELMKYRCQEGISLPFRVLPIINEMGRTRLEVSTPLTPTPCFRTSFQLSLLASVKNLPVLSVTWRATDLARHMPDHC